MTTEDRAYEAAARELVKSPEGVCIYDDLPPRTRHGVVIHAKLIVDAFLTAMGQEVQ